MKTRYLGHVSPCFPYPPSLSTAHVRQPLPPLELPLGSAKSCSFSASLLRVWGVWCVCARTCMCHVMKTVLYFFLSVFFFFFELFTLYWSVAS